MDYSSLKSLAETQDWLALWPEISMCVVGLLLLTLDVLLPSNLNKWVPRIGTLLVLIILGFSVTCFIGCPMCREKSDLFGGMIEITALSQWFRGFFLVSNLAVFWVASNYLKNRALVRTEFYAVTSIVTAAMMLLVQANHFVVLFVALETIAIGLYVLVAYDRNSLFSMEAGLKYLVMGGTNTAILLLGIALLYGVAGNPSLPGSTQDSLSFANLATFLGDNSDNMIAKFGVLAILASVAFKVGLVPFQIWIPDVYQGAPTPTTAFLSVSSKAAGVAVLLLLFGQNGVFLGMSSFVFPVLLTVTIISMIYGNVAALGYTNVKRLLGMSGVSHAAFLMIGILVMMQVGEVSWISGAVLFYLAAYLLASYIVFGVMSIVSTENDEDQDLYDYNGLSEQRPFLAVMLAIGIGSLAGIPPLVGFMAKFSLFVAAYQTGMYVLLAFAILGVVISIYYYFKWIREVFYKDPVADLKLNDSEPEQKVFQKASAFSACLLVLLAVAVVVLGVYPMDLLSSWNLF